jgi:hypothetical protein
MTTETLAPAVAPETVSPIKPSEALRLGRLTRPLRSARLLFAGTDAACALGAMALGWGLDDPGDVGDPVDDTDLWPLLSDGPVQSLDAGTRTFITATFDSAEWCGRNGDAAVLEYLESRGL